jgi:predicted RNase H-like HicB family nuclease
MSDTTGRSDERENDVRYMVLFEKTADGWSAYLPDVPGCTTTGATVDEVLVNMKEALELWLEVAQEQGEAAPVATHVLAAFVEVDARVPAGTS